MPIDEDIYSEIILPDTDFSNKEQAVIREFLTGDQYKVIANRLNMSPSAFEYHIRNVMNKTGCKTKTDLMIFLKKELVQNKDNKFRYKTVILIILFTAVVVLSTTTVFWKKFTPESKIITSLPSFQENALDRTIIVSKAEELLKNQSGINIIAIVGEGGAGKTFIGRKILSRCNAKICWEINAETQDSAYNSFLDLANRMATRSTDIVELEKINRLHDFNEKRKKIMNFVAKFLHRSNDWCLLFDNVDSIRDIRGYIPQNTENFGHGSIIITTRDIGIGDVNFIRHSNVINIGHLDENEQLELFCNILYQQQFLELDKDLQRKIHKFLRKIPAMPLDTVAAAYYLKNTKITFAEYEKIMRNSYRDLKGMQERLLEKNVNYNKTRYGIVSSVFEEILRRRQDFQILLFTICMLDSQNLPKKLLRLISESGNSDEFLYDLRRHSLIIDNDDYISIHRSTQSIGLDYLLSILSDSDRNKMIKRICKVLTPYEDLERTFTVLNKLIPHFRACLKNINKMQDKQLNENKVALLLTIGDIYRHRTHQLQDALVCFKEALQIRENFLNKSDLGLVYLKAGEVCTVMGKNDEAMSYLNKGANLLSGKQSLELARTHRLSGVLCMRKGDFQKANKCFDNALNILKNEPDRSLEVQLLVADTYSDMAFNYFMNGINRKEAKSALEIIQRAIDTLSEIKTEVNPAMKLRITGRLAVYKSRLAGVYNALGQYKLALKIADEAEKTIDSLEGMENTNIVYARGVISRERGLSNLRLNNIPMAYNYFLRAKKIFTKSCVEDYLFRLKMHEIECLIRLNKFDEALSVCNEVFSMKNRERNNYCDLFYNTCYYHAAVIAFRKGDKVSEQKYFRNFFKSMKHLCKNILDNSRYKLLLDSRVFESGSTKTCFENSLIIFEAIYWKDYEFTKYYVEKNLKIVQQ